MISTLFSVQSLDNVLFAVVKVANKNPICKRKYPPMAWVSQLFRILTGGSYE